MKPWTSICAGLVSLLFTAGVSAATNRTTRLGQIDSVADSSFIRLLDSPQTEKVFGVSALPRSAEGLPSRSVPEGVELLPYAQNVSLLKLPALPGRYPDTAQLDVVAISKDDNFELYLMLAVAAGLIALHLRRKQKSLQHRPLAELMYR